MKKRYNHGPPNGMIADQTSVISHNIGVRAIGGSDT